MNVLAKCPKCDAGLPIDAADAPGEINCGRCGRTIPLHATPGERYRARYTVLAADPSTVPVARVERIADQLDDAGWPEVALDARLLAGRLALDRGAKSDRAKEVGKLLAERARAAGIGRVVFDRGGRIYHGRVRAVADGAREGGLQI